MTMSKDKVNPYWISQPPKSLQIWGMTPAERLDKQLSKATFQDGSILLFHGDGVYDKPVIQGLLASPNTLVADQEPMAAHVPENDFETAKSWLCDNGPAPDDMKILNTAQIGAAYDHELRKNEDAQSHILHTDNETDNTKDIEWALYMTAYKGVTDFVTKYWWPIPAFHVTRFCAQTRLTPNMVTSIGAILMLLALWFFAQGQYAAGLACGWAMTFLDTVDGKLARCTLTSSYWGHLFDHSIDLFHPPFWYIAWGVGLAAYGTPLADGLLTPILITMFATYVLGRVVEGYFITRFKMHIHVWRRCDSVFRLILARRNPNMILLTLSLIIGRPDLGLLAVTAWTAATFIIHIGQSLQAEWITKRGGTITSWLNA